MIARVRGTQDITDMRLQRYVLDRIYEHLGTSNFHEIKTPILEHTALFTHALGEATDVVSKEMYVFDSQAEGEDTKSVCLRPEVTASMVRACYENRIDRFPWKVFQYGPMFRRERPQKGRLREFHQVSLEVIGSASFQYDVMLIKLLDSLFGDVFKLTNYVLKLNFLGCSGDRLNHKASLQTFLNDHIVEICKTCQERKDTNTLRVFDCKNPTCQSLYRKAPKLTDYLCESCSHEWEHVQQLLHMLSVSYVIDDFLVRGLDYYRSIVFEFMSSDLGAQSAFCGGGRYCLGRHVGAAEDYDAVGAGIGIERLLMLVEMVQDQLAIRQKPPLTVIMPLGEAQVSLALIVANELKQEGITVDVVLELASMSKMMKRANRMGATFVGIIGEDEQRQGKMTIKNMVTGESSSVTQTDVARYIKS